MGWYDGGGRWDNQPERGTLEESPLRKRARQRAERAARSTRNAISSLFLVAAGALLIPMVLIFGGYFVRRALNQGFPQPPDSAPLVVTSTPPPLLIVSKAPQAWLSATPAAASTFPPGFFVNLGVPQTFASATPGFTLAKSQIVYVCHIDHSDEICLMNADGSDNRQLTDTPNYTDWYPSFTPDGQHILFSSQRSGPFDIFMMDLNGNNIRQITHDVGDAYAPSMSPDGSQIVFTSTRTGVQNIWSISTDGTGLQQLTTDNRDNVDPVWSPDGTLVSFTSTHRGNGDLMMMNADGSNLRRITTQINVEGRNAWSPDGRWLAFYAGPVGDKEIYIVDSSCAYEVDGCNPSQMRQLTDGGNNKAPDFSPDGQWITFTSELQGGINNVFIARVDGSEYYQLTYGTKADWQPRWGPWRP